LPLQHTVGGGVAYSGIGPINVRATYPTSGPVSTWMGGRLTISVCRSTQPSIPPG